MYSAIQYRNYLKDKNRMTDDGSEHPEERQEKSGPGRMPKKTLIIAGIIIVLFLIAVIAVPGIMRSPPQHGSGQSPVIKNFTQPETGLSVARTATIPKT